MAFAEGLATGQGCRVIRLDTYEGNAPAAAFYPKLGYRLAGSAEFFFEGFARENLICFEKELRGRRGPGRRETAGRARLRRLCLPPLQRRQKLHKLRPCLLLREL